MCLCHKNLDWRKYINDEVPDREEYENALAVCPGCLQEYISLLGDLEAPTPDFSDAVMAVLPTSGGGHFFAYKPLLHYLVAACLTLVFMELGVFDWMNSSQLAPDSDLFSSLLDGLNNVIGTLKTNLGGM